MLKIKDLLDPARLLVTPTSTRLGTMPSVVAMGIEVELEGCLVELHPELRVRSFVEPRTLTHVTLEHGIDAHRDGSLRGGGIELVTPPLRGKEIDDAVTYMCGLAKKFQWNESNRAGIHVHVDVQNLTIKQFADFMCIYALVEPALFNWVGEGRDASIFCKAWTDDTMSEDLKSYVEVLRDIAQDGVDPESVRLFRLHTRYSSVNLESVRKYGTLEFRHLRTTTNDDRILQWCRMIQLLNAYATNVNLTQSKMNAYRPDTILTEVFGSMLGQHLWYDGFESYFYHRSLPLCNYIFWPIRSGRVEWTTPTKKTGKHAGFEKFAKSLTTPPAKKRAGITRLVDMHVPAPPTTLRDLPRVQREVPQLFTATFHQLTEAPRTNPTVDPDWMTRIFNDVIEE